MKKYVYLAMPVTTETKREWNAKGYRVLDIAFMPEGYENPAEDKPATDKPVKRGRAKG